MMYMLHSTCTQTNRTKKKIIKEKEKKNNFWNLCTLTKTEFILKSIKFFTSAVSSRSSIMPFLRITSPSMSLYFCSETKQRNRRKKNNTNWVRGKEKKRGKKITRTAYNIISYANFSLYVCETVYGRIFDWWTHSVFLVSTEQCSKVYDGKFIRLLYYHASTYRWKYFVSFITLFKF